MRVTSEVRSENGAEHIYVNGKKIAPMAYTTYISENNQYPDFAAAGYKLYSVTVFFGTNRMNENSGLYVLGKGIFDGFEPDFSSFDRDIERILNACPDAMIFPRVNVSPSETWEWLLEDELCDSGSTSFPERRRASVSSNLWAEEIKKNLTSFISHIESMPYRDSIIGYQVAGGNTEEWIAYDGNGYSGKRSRERYADYLKTSGVPDSEEEYYRFLSRTVAERIIEFARHIKKLTDSRLIVGSFYGYTLELCHKTNAHYALGMLVRSECIDFICSPVSYSSGRALGKEHAYMLPINSLKEHGKLYFAENDTRTHLSRALNDMPAYNRPIWFGPNKQDSLEILKMHFSKALIHGHALWWFDMWGGWYDDPSYMDFMRRAREIAEEASELPLASVSEVAVFIDEDAYSEIPKEESARDLVWNARRELGIIGTPHDIYLASDFEAVRKKYKAYITIVPASTAKSDEIQRYAKENGIPNLEIRKEMSAEGIKKYLKEADVHIYSEEPIILYVNQSYIFIHTIKFGVVNLNLPQKCKLECAFTAKKFESYFVSEGGKSYLFRKIY